MKNPLICLIFLSALTIGCNKTVNQPFTGLFNGEITPSAGNGGGGSTASIQILSTANMTAVSNSPVAVSNMIYDGDRLLLIDTAGGWPVASNIRYDYVSTSLTSQGQSTTNYGGSVNNVVLSPGPSAGQSTLYWGGDISVRDDSSGAVLSTTAINFSSYGCTSNEVITYCGGEYYGACTTGSGYLRFFSFNSAATMQSAVTTTASSTTYNTLDGIACYGGNALILVTSASSSASEVAFYKYDLSFNLIASDTSSSGQFPSGLLAIAGVATDGTNLYLQGAMNNAVNPPTWVMATATLGSLK